MSLRGDAIRLRESLKSHLDDREPVLIRFPAMMGDGEGNLYPDAGEPTIVFVRRYDRGRIDRVRNTRVGAKNNLPVIVGFSPERPDELQILDVDAVAMSSMGAYGYVMHHHQAHELFNPQGGDDTVWVWSQQFLPFLVQVTDPLSLQLYVRMGRYIYNNTWRTFGGAITVDMDAFEPAAGLAVMVLISVNASSMILQYTSSGTFSEDILEELRNGMIPATPEDSISCAAIYITNGITEVDWNIIYDCRPFVQPRQGGIPHNILSQTHLDTSPESLVRGDLLVAQPILSRMAIGGDRQMLIVDVAGELPKWNVFDWDLLAAAGGADMEHDHSSGAQGGPDIHNLREFEVRSTTELTIAAGFIARTQVYHRVDTEGDAPTDNLDSIGGGTTGDILIIRPESNVRDIVIRTGIVNIILSGGIDITLDNINDHITLIYNGAFWCDAGPAGLGGALAWPGAAGYALVSTATTVTWSLTPTWLGVHTFSVGMVVDGGTNPLLDINPTHTDTCCVIDITPTAAITNVGAVWEGFCIDGSALDPTVVDVSIHGISIDFSGVSVANRPHIDGLHIQTPFTYHREMNHALHTHGGGVWMDWDSTASTALDTFTTINVVVQTAGATGGDSHVLDVARGGNGTVDVVAVGTHTDVDVIHQHIGTFVVTGKAWEWEAGPVWTDQTAAFGNPAADVEIFSADNDLVYISGPDAATTFDEIEVVLNTSASVSIKPVFEYSVGGPAWTQFYPADDTNGFRQNGLIRWDASNLAGWVQIDVNAEGTNRYWIRITRTRNNMVTPPIEDTIKVLDATIYYWNKSGDVYTANYFVPDGGVIGNGAATARLVFDSSGAIDYAYFDSCYVGVGESVPENTHLVVRDNTLTSTATFVGIHNQHVKTGGAGGAGDDYYGIWNYIELNQATVVDNVYGCHSQSVLTLGTADRLYGGSYTTTMNGGTINQDTIGLVCAVTLNLGTLSTDTYGASFIVDSNAGMTAVNGDIYGLHILVDDDAGATGTVFMLYLKERTGIDYGIYQDGTANNYFGGNVGIAMVPTANGLLCLGTPTENLEIIDAGSAGATEQDWVEVEVGGVQGYLHVFVAK